MKAMHERTPEEHKRLRAKQSEVLRAVWDVPKMDLFTDFQRTWDATGMSYRFEGVYSQRLVARLGRKPDPEDMIILVNGSIAHGGAHCIMSGDAFKGRVNV